jgi:hypothetical protein
MATTFRPHPNNVSATLAVARAAGSGSLVLEPGAGARFGSVFPMTVTAITAFTYGTPQEASTILNVTARAGDTLTVSGPIEGTTDRDFAVGDHVDVRYTDAQAKALESAVNALENGVLYLAGGTISGQLGVGGTPPGTQLMRVEGSAFNSLLFLAQHQATGTAIGVNAQPDGAATLNVGLYSQPKNAGTNYAAQLIVAGGANDWAVYAQGRGRFAGVTDQVQLTVAATAAQVSHIQDWVNASGAIATYVSATGVFTGDGSVLSNLNASNLSSGQVPPARLGTGSAVSTNFLRGDGTWYPLFHAVSKPGSGSIVTTDTLCYCDSSAGAVTLTLPSPSTCVGVEFIFFRADSSANAITIQRQGTDTIGNGGSSVTVPTGWGKFVRLVAMNSTQWLVVGSN